MTEIPKFGYVRTPDWFCFLTFIIESLGFNYTLKSSLPATDRQDEKVTYWGIKKLEIVNIVCP